MKRLFPKILFPTVVVLLGWAAGSLPAANEAGPVVTWAAEKTYEGFTPNLIVTFKSPSRGEVLKMHIFLPPAPAEHRPAVVFFFGGGWRAGAPTAFYPQSAHLAQLGVVCFSAQYRTEGSHGTTVAEAAADARSAIRWVRKNARLFGVDSERIGAGGGSAGGHLAATAALCDGFDDPTDDLSVSCRPALLILYNPVVDNSPAGFGNDRVKGYWERISPLHHIHPGAPPTIFLIGTKDQHVPVATSRKYADLMQAAGAVCDLKLYEDQIHSFFGYREAANPYYWKTLLAVTEFLKRREWIAANVNAVPPHQDQ